MGPEDSCGGTVRFQVIADGKTAAESRVLRGGEALDLRADVTGAREVTLRVGNGGDGNGCDHAAWGLARFLAPGAADPFAGDAAAVPVDLSSLKGDRVRTAVLTPIAEGPGRTGSSPQDVKGRACAEREAVLFDAAIVPAASAR